ncbi:unnamed protein product [Zymoseptoria tritici ST99CH_1A5]|uniref:Uncharacterized protein n=2 Tax=Zymoseptoria tritici TaxID=1047171 RepID=A0A2H1H5J3_ZYMTR|nr:unnamed protein product [Zymoseptoria tritici ST99CH_1E4]SMR64231.1 unnamed protein product [Zymoseptoria tritici ST99CH_3D1]SMY29575.1 unnamed protein product [Zymoseptoria tritici ST99CH_1A5]
MPERPPRRFQPEGQRDEVLSRAVFFIIGDIHSIRPEAINRVPVLNLSLSNIAEWNNALTLLLHDLGPEIERTIGWDQEPTDYPHRIHAIQPFDDDLNWNRLRFEQECWNQRNRLVTTIIRKTVHPTIQDYMDMSFWDAHMMISQIRARTFHRPYFKAGIARILEDAGATLEIQPR